MPIRLVVGKKGLLVNSGPRLTHRDKSEENPWTGTRHGLARPPNSADCAGSAIIPRKRGNEAVSLPAVPASARVAFGVAAGPTLDEKGPRRARLHGTL